MKDFQVNIRIYTQAVCERNIENWIDDFVIPDLMARWGDGSIIIESDIEEISDD